MTIWVSFIPMLSDLKNNKEIRHQLLKWTLLESSNNSTIQTQKPGPKKLHKILNLKL